MPNPLKQNKLFVPLSSNLTADTLSDLILQLESNLNLISEAINSRVIGEYSESELPAGMKFYPRTPAIDGRRSNASREVFRKVIDTGALPNNTTKTISHDIDMSGSASVDGTPTPLFRTINIYGCATKPNDGNPESFPIPNPEHAYVTIDGTNIYITTLFDASTFTESHIVIEYILS